MYHFVIAFHLIRKNFFIDHIYDELFLILDVSNKDKINRFKFSE